MRVVDLDMDTESADVTSPTFDDQLAFARIALGALSGVLMLFLAPCIAMTLYALSNAQKCQDKDYRSGAVGAIGFITGVAATAVTVGLAAFCLWAWRWTRRRGMGHF